MHAKRRSVRDGGRDGVRDPEGPGVDGLDFGVPGLGVVKVFEVARMGMGWINGVDVVT